MSSHSRSIDYLKLRRGYASALYEKIISSTGTPVSLLDIACGPGTVIIGLKPHIKDAWGIDADADRIAEASKLSEDNIRFSHVPVEKFSTDKQFDLITIAQAFQYLPETHYGNIGRHLRPGGTLAVFWKYPDVSTPVSKMFSETISPREDMGARLKTLGLEEKLAPLHMTLETYAEFKSEEIYKQEDWIQSSLWGLHERHEGQEEALRNRAPKYVTETFINYLWLFRKA